jgi:hypothetical protein
VRVKFADDIADGTRGFLVLGVRLEAELAHRVDDAALHGLQAVRDIRQGAIEDDVHGVVQVRLLGELAKRQMFDTVSGNFGHGIPDEARLEGALRDEG